jgi:acetate kinase
VNILVLNAGSSSLKFRHLKLDGANESVLATGHVEKWGTPDASLRLEITGHPPIQRSVAAETPRDAAEHAIRECLPFGIDALGHRVVHGGPTYEEPAVISPAVIEGIREVSHLAPLHNGLALAAIEAGLAVLPRTPAIAVFDTAFHRTMPDVAALYAIPRELAEKHALRRYGFHGISHRYVSQRLLQLLNRDPAGTRLITCHLGNGASLCAIRDGRCIDTSMGLTPMEGLVMGTRSGDVDPGLVLHLMTTLNMSADDVDDLLNRRSGMLGISGRSGDVRDLEQAAGGGDARAAMALEMFAYRARKYLGAYAAALGGVDAIAFAGGIGEHSASTRHRICRGLDFLGIKLDPGRNAATPPDHETSIEQSGSAIRVWVIPTDEERQIAREVRELLQSRVGDPPP